MRKKSYYLVMLIAYMIILISFIGKMCSIHQPVKHKIEEIEIEVTDYGKPIVPTEDSVIPEYKRAYYDHLYDY